MPQGRPKNRLTFLCWVFFLDFFRLLSLSHKACEGDLPSRPDRELLALSRLSLPLGRSKARHAEGRPRK